MPTFTLVVSGTVELRAKNTKNALAKLNKMTHDVSFQYEVGDLKRIGLELQVDKAFKDGYQVVVPRIQVKIP